jgi:serine/threonine-protein kinase
MPSEQARGKPRLSSDVYAVGMIGIQALTGIAPDSLQEDANTGEILWRDRAQVSNAFAEVLQKMVFSHFSQRYKSAIDALHAMKSLGATNINNIAPTEAIAYPLFSSDSSPTIVTNTGGATAPASAPTTPQHPVTTPHVTVSTPNPAFSKFQPFLWFALTGVISVSAAITTVMLIPKLTNQTGNNTQIEATKTPTSSPSASPTTSPSTETSEPLETETPEPPPVVPTSNPTMISFGAIARSPSTQDKGYSWNYTSQIAAEERALSECENNSSSGDCKILVWARNACMSIAEGSNGSAGAGWSTDMTAAENTAKQVCQQYKGVDCAITRTICLPFQQ